jgi:hypothetical protein
MPDEPKTMQGEDLGPCPFCGRSIAYGINPVDGMADSLLHTMPMCEKFESMDVEEFVVAMRKELERKRPS